MARQDHDVPRLDLDDLLSDDATRRDGAARTLCDGYGSLGLVALAGHGIEDADVDAYHDAFLAFTSRPEADKRVFHRGDLWNQRGWTPPNTERAVVAGGRPDYKECWFAAPEPLDPACQALYPQLFADNVWPDDAPVFREQHMRLGHQLHTLGRHLLRGAERGLGLDEGTFDAVLEGGAHVTRALRYLPLDEAATHQDVLWGEEHTDFNLLTVLAGGRFFDPQGRAAPAPDDRAGLYLRTRPTAEHPRGRMVRGQAPKGHLVSQVGQQLEILTGGVFQATPHVVKAPGVPGWTRTSMAHFVHVHPLRPLTPLAPFRTPEALEAYRPPVLAGTYAIKTLVDIHLAPAEALHSLGYRHYDRLAAIRRDGEW